MGRRKEVDDPWSSDLSLPIGSVMTGMLSLPLLLAACIELFKPAYVQRDSLSRTSTKSDETTVCAVSTVTAALLFVSSSYARTVIFPGMQ